MHKGKNETGKIVENRRRAPLAYVGPMVLIVFAIGSFLLLTTQFASTRLPATNVAASPTPSPRPPCRSNDDCLDTRYCNGGELCSPSSPLADARGCVSVDPPCRPDQRCLEDESRCLTILPGCERGTDRDGDGVDSTQCEGTDCNDDDANTFPLNAEVCDAEGHDEDCDPDTYGHRDLDRDGEDDFRCFNRKVDGTIIRGTDYDDTNPAARQGSMICDGPDAVVVSDVVSASGAQSLPCARGTKCVVQPNRTGVCMVPPTDYVAPARFVAPRFQPLPLLRTLLAQRNAGRLPRANVPNLSRQPSVPREQPAVTRPSPTPSTTISASGSPEEVAECRRTLQSGKISWGGGTKWTAANIDKLCKGTKDAKATIACFQANVGALGWSAAIDRCK